MRVFVTGANGFIGGAVASALIADGHKVRGLVRDKVKADTVAAQGIEPVVGSLDDAALLQAEARAADAVVNAANSDHRGAVEALIAGLAGSGKPFLHSSGSSIVADLAMGEPSDRIFHEGTPIKPQAEKAARVAIDRLVLNAPGITAGAERPDPCARGASQGVRHRALHRTRTEPLVERAYRRCRGALCTGPHESTRRHIHVCRERRRSVGRNCACDRGAGKVFLRRNGMQASIITRELRRSVSVS